MNQDFNAWQAIVWNATSHDPYSVESIAKRMLSQGVAPDIVAELFGFEDNIEVISYWQNDISNLTERINAEIVELKEKLYEIRNRDFESFFHKAKRDVNEVIARAYGLTKTQLIDFCVQIDEDEDALELY